MDEVEKILLCLGWATILISGIVVGGILCATAAWPVEVFILLLVIIQILIFISYL